MRTLKKEYENTLEIVNFIDWYKEAIESGISEIVSAVDKALYNLYTVEVETHHDLDAKIDADVDATRCDSPEASHPEKPEPMECCGMLLEPTEFRIPAGDELYFVPASIKEAYCDETDPSWIMDRVKEKLPAPAQPLPDEDAKTEQNHLAIKFLVRKWKVLEKRISALEEEK